MIRPHIDITMAQGFANKIYPPMQWNGVTSTRKMLSDVQEWLHCHYPTWERAIIYFTHYGNGRSHTDMIRIIRGQML